MRHVSVLLATVLLLLLGGFPRARAQEAPVLVMGTKESPPFAMKDDTGQWTGISIEIWSRVAQDLGVSTKYVEVAEVEDLLDGVASGRFDLASSAVTVTAEREKKCDFSYPYFFTGLAIAVAPHGAPWRAVVRGLLSPSFWKVVGGMMLLLLLVGILVWWIEAKANPDHFGGGAQRGIGSGFWWAAVTMTTVGYGDKAPRTGLGRGVALIWMFAGIVLISILTAAITSTLTVSQLGSPIRGPDDLHGVRVVGVQGTSSVDYLDTHGVHYQPVDSLQVALDLVAAGKADCVVYDEPLLRYQIRTDYQGKVVILPGIFDRQQYAIALPPRSRYRERINISILEQIQSDWWDATLRRYLGD